MMVCKLAGEIRKVGFFEPQREVSAHHSGVIRARGGGA